MYKLILAQLYVWQESQRCSYMDEVTLLKTGLKETLMSITVYSKPRCPQCTATYRAMDKLGISYETVDITEDAEALEFILGLGHKQAPVVVTETDNWSGFRPDSIKALAAVGASAN